MALIKSATMTSASGSVGGVTYSHNRSGMYMRARRIPVNPNTAFQQDSRNALAAGSAAWRAITEAQRVAWNAYAAATPVTNALGDTIFLTGQQQYVATVTFGQLIGNTIASYADAPVTPGRVAVGTPGVVLDASASTAALTAVGAGVDTIAVFIGDPQSAGVSFFKGPYQLRGFDQPVAGAITINGMSGRNGLPFVAGQVLPVRLRGISADGNLSTVHESLVTVVA